MDPSPPDDNLAQSLFLECCAAGGDFDALCRAHPELRERLIAVQRQFARGQALLQPLAAAPAHLEATAQIDADARYEHSASIGAGGMGRVSEVFDRKLGRRVALKALREPSSSGAVEQLLRARRRARLVAEAQVLARLEHPAILPIYDLEFDERGEPSFTMLRVRGIELEQAFEAARERRDGWSDARLLEVLSRVCEAIAHAHSRGVLHRDIKPSNVMVGAYGEVFVMDWGLAKVLNTNEARSDGASTHPSGAHEPLDSPAALDLTMEGEVLGTPAYMAPEQARGSAEVGPAVDVYSLGALIYRWLSGHPPYLDPGRSLTTAELLASVRSGAPTPLRAVAHGRPPELIAIAEKAMRRAPEQRYASAAELLADLRAYAEDRSGSAWRDGVRQRALKWVRRQPAQAVAAFALTLAVAGGLATNERMSVLAARAEQSQRGERERRMEQDLARLREFESTQQQEPRARMLRNEQAAFDCVEALARAGVDLEHAGWPQALARAEQELSAQARPALTALAYLLVRYLHLAGMGMAHATTQGARLSGDPADWARMAAEHERAVAVWPQAIRMARSALPGGLGARVAELFAARQSGKIEISELTAQAWPGATAIEREFAAVLVKSCAGLQAAQPLLEALLRDYPDSAWAHIQMSVLFVERKQDERARAHALAALAAWPESSLAHNNMGALLARAQDREGALRHYLRACELLPDDAGCLLNAAAHFNLLGRPSEALDYLEAVAGEQRESSQAEWIAGTALVELGLELGHEPLLNAARERLRRACKLDPSRRDAWLAWGQACEVLELPHEALDAYRGGLEALPDSGNIKLALASLAWELGLRCEAVELALEVRRAHPASQAPSELLEGFRQTLFEQLDIETFEAWTDPSG